MMIVAGAMAAFIAASAVAGLKACATYVTDDAYVTDVAQGFSPADDASSPKLRVGWAEFKKQYDDDTIVVVDVRDAGSYEAGHIPKAWLVPLNDIEQRAGELKRLKKPIVTYCA